MLKSVLWEERDFLISLGIVISAHRKLNGTSQEALALKAGNSRLPAERNRSAGDGPQFHDGGVLSNRGRAGRGADRAAGRGKETDGGRRIAGWCIEQRGDAQSIAERGGQNAAFRAEVLRRQSRHRA